MSQAIAEYDAEAATYDSSRFSDNFGVHLDNVHKQILETLVDSTGQLLLEVGIGTGRFGVWLAKKGFRVVGVDISRQMLKKAKEKAYRMNTDIDVIIADVHYLPFGRGLFDNCICINVLEHFSNISAFLKEVRHVIKSQGSFVFNFANSQSPYFPIAATINLSGHALFKRRILSKWLTLREVSSSLATTSFRIEIIRGCMIASQIPFGKELVPLVRIVNSVSQTSWLRFFSGSVFVKVGLLKR